MLFWKHNWLRSVKIVYVSIYISIWLKLYNNKMLHFTVIRLWIFGKLKYKVVVHAPLCFMSKFLYEIVFHTSQKLYSNINFMYMIPWNYYSSSSWILESFSMVPFCTEHILEKVNALRWNIFMCLEGNVQLCLYLLDVSRFYKVITQKKHITHKRSFN